MKYRVLKSKDQIINTWSGGTTTQLTIYPEGSEYKKLDFDFRISTATVTIPQSTFTHLPTVHRHLMILDGELEITHHDHYTKKIETFEQDEFEGDWHTRAKGMVTDFNLMLRNGKVGSLEKLKLSKEETLKLNLSSKFLGIYLYQGELVLNENDKLEEKDFVLISDINGSIQLTALIECSGVVVRIN